ncbi:uncharacterized protein PV07_12270 [Cladophialophora immunda]|uniref:Uncharacterized protein n=1 Tax=Cladophialophora immunda TaxID=569365 RepID=A0A0D2BVD1_9EURO|nr:uncharacterized protein PV07_12270 [Cladophialophora immunda]KIW22380.1 hypothetical protein PV07_12270 [Cladophialophora immunda]
MLMSKRQARRGSGKASDPHNGMRNGRGRPMKRLDQLKPPRRVRTLQASLIHKQLTAEVEPARIISALEALPVEIIEQIFFHCLELNLPRASVHLARALSRPSVYSALVLFAYFEADSSARVETRHFLPATYRPIGFDDQLRLQRDILRSRWCTWEFLHSCMPALARLAMVRHWHREREQLTAARSAGARQKHLDAYVELPDPDVLLPAIDDISGMERHFRLRSAMLPDKPHDEAAAADPPSTHPPLIIETTHLSNIAGQTPGQPNEVSLSHVEQSVLAAHIIPDNLVLRKPWTDTSIKLLQLLRQAVRFGACAAVPSPQAMFEGMASAVQEGNDKALLVLLELYDTVVQQRHPDQPLPLHLLHVACKASTLPAGRQSRMMSLLLRGAVENVPADDDILTRWAIHTANSTRAEHDLLVARRVLKHMENQGGPNDPSGRASGAQGDEHWSPASFTEEIGYLERTSAEV